MDATRRAFHWAYVSRFLIAIGVTFLIGAIISFFGSLTAIALTGLGLEELQGLQEDGENLNALRIVQAFSLVGFFFLPALLIPLLFGKNPLQYLQFRWNLNLKWVAISLGALIVALPVVGLSMIVNEAITFPEFLSDLEERLREQHRQIEELTEKFVRMDYAYELLINILLIAVLPAVAEELYFRGFLQKFFQKWSGGAHLAIWLSALIFSLIHFQFFALLPRLLLGALFGYMLLYTGNIWYPILAHFFNNFLVLMSTYLLEPLNQDWSMNWIANYPYLYQVLVLVFLILLVFTLYQLSKRKGRKEQDITEDWYKVYTTTDKHRAGIIKGMLDSNQIDAVIMDKRDSAYMAFGEIHIYTNYEEASRALQLIKEYEEEESAQ